MPLHQVTFDNVSEPVLVPTGTLLSEAAKKAGLDIGQPCGGQGRCGRCSVKVQSPDGKLRTRSRLRLTEEDIAAGYVLACQSMVEGDVVVSVPPQEKIERRMTTDRIVAEIQVPADYDPLLYQTIRRFDLTLTPPSLDDQTDDWSRVQTAIRQQAGTGLTASLTLLRKLGRTLRSAGWQVSAIVAFDSENPSVPARLIDLLPGHAEPGAPLWGLAIDIGTTTVSVWLVDLISGKVRAQVAEYNGQILRGEDVISRIIYASKGRGGEELRELVIKTINDLIDKACKRVHAQPEQIIKATIVGNSTMMHLLLGLPAENIRMAPFVTTINHIPSLSAADIGLKIHSDAQVDCLPGVASYVGADITAGVLSSGQDSTEAVTLFIDVGTNGEIVLGNKDWLVTCACSAGPAFEGSGVINGMRATHGAIEEVWINHEDFEPTYRVIGGEAPRGLCGSGLISLMGEMFLTGVIDKSGNINETLKTPRIRVGPHGLEYVVAWAKDSANDRDISITRVDVDNLLRAKAAIYAGFDILAERIGMTLDMAEQVLIGGSFGKYINVEKAVEIGLLPDMEWDRFQFLGNTAVRGAYMSLLDYRSRERIKEIAARMTYIELSADNSFYEAFTSALFLPHTNLSRFPSVSAVFEH